MSDCFFKQEISSAILLSLVLIHCKLIPRGELISNEQKKQTSKRSILDLLHVCSVQDNAEVLSVMFSSTVFCNIGRSEDVKCCAVVDNHCHELKSVD